MTISSLELSSNKQRINQGRFLIWLQTLLCKRIVSCQTCTLQSDVLQSLLLSNKPVCRQEDFQWKQLSPPKRRQILDEKHGNDDNFPQRLLTYGLFLFKPSVTSRAFSSSSAALRWLWSVPRMAVRQEATVDCNAAC